MVRWRCRFPHTVKLLDVVPLLARVVKELGVVHDEAVEYSVERFGVDPARALDLAISFRTSIAFVLECR